MNTEIEKQEPNQHSNLAHSKSEARLAAVEAIYSQAINQDKKLASSAISDVLYYYENDKDLIQPNKKFLSELVTGSNKYKDSLEEIIKKHLMDNWRFERLGVIIQSILIVASFELAHYKDTPHKVIINEYVDIAKCFCDDSDVAFINGILDSINSYLRENNSTN